MLLFRKARYSDAKLNFSSGTNQNKLNLGDYITFENKVKQFDMLKYMLKRELREIVFPKLI